MCMQERHTLEKTVGRQLQGSTIMDFRTYSATALRIRRWKRMYLYLRYSLWMRLRINFGTFGPGEMRWSFSLEGQGDFTMSRVIILPRTTITAIWSTIPTFFRPRTLGLERTQRSSLAVEFILSEGGRGALSLRYRWVPLMTSVMSRGNSLIDMCFVKPW